MRALFATSECVPWAKTGGLADVSSALPAALRAEGVDVHILMPRYAGMAAGDLPEVLALPARQKLPAARLCSARLPNGVPALLVDCPALYARCGGPYQDPAGADWADNALRFAQLARAAAEAAVRLGFDVVHCNDWQSALALAYLRQARASAGGVLTVHNLAFQGLFDPSVVAEIGLPAEYFGIEGLEFHGRCSFLKGGLVYADRITTVSPKYAEEIQTPEHGMGLHGLLAWRRDVLHGIVNGIDDAEWNPRRDRHIAVRYDAATLEGKAQNKAALRAELGLRPAEGPLAAMICRLTEQKGVDLVLAAAPLLLAGGAQLAVLGTGDPSCERALQALAAAHPRDVAVRNAFDEGLAHRMEAGADVFLMPSRFEPCGMNQMYSQRYGTLPVVRATGGLVDTVVDADAAPGSGTGFVFRDATPDALAEAFARARAAWGVPARWRGLQQNAMRRDFGWAASARAYRQVYTGAAERATPRRAPIAIS